MRRLLLWCGAVMGLLFAGVLLDTVRAASTAPLTHAAVAADHHDNAPRFTAAVLLQREDCNGNLRVLDLLHREGVGEHIALRTLWYVGPPQDTLAIRLLLPRWTRAVPLRPASPPLVRSFRALGHRSTPVLVMYDHEGRVRLTTQSPRSPREFAGLRRAIEGLTWIQEL